jgi:hypothetical protein
MSPVGPGTMNDRAGECQLQFTWTKTSPVLSVCVCVCVCGKGWGLSTLALKATFVYMKSNKNAYLAQSVIKYCVYEYIRLLNGQTAMKKQLLMYLHSTVMQYS